MGATGEIAHQLEGLVGDQRLVDRVRVRHQQQRVAVGRPLGDDVGADHRSGAGPVVDHETLAERFLQALAMNRAYTSAGPPAANGTTTRTGRDG